MFSLSNYFINVLIHHIIVTVLIINKNGNHVFLNDTEFLKQVNYLNFCHCKTPFTINFKN